jgi:hypothetical protein
LAGAEEEEFELRLLSDPKFGEEFDTVVDEITDEYLQNELPDEERERVQQYFLSSTERQGKLEFAAELLRRAEAERAKEDARPSFFEQIAAFWKRPGFALIVAGVLIVAGILYFVVWRDNSTSYLAMDVAISASDRAEGTKPPTAKLAPKTGLELTLTIPENARGGKDYDASLKGGSHLKIEKRTDQTVTVRIPAGTLGPGVYAIQLFKDKERLPGSYVFAIE